MKRKSEEEVWKDIPGYGGLYQASNLGRIKSIMRTCKCVGKNQSTRTVPEKILLGQMSSKKYRGCLLYINGKRKWYAIHRLILTTFNGIDNKRVYANHKNGIKTDNRLCNLEWVTPKENYDHAVNVLGFDKFKYFKLKENDIYKIIKLLDKNISVKEIAKKFKVTDVNIGLIKNNKSWKHIKR